ncbi:MAG: hypothetical protein ACJ71Q_10500 [Terriglobales bacterium]|jgi:hypothetical protein
MSETMELTSMELEGETQGPSTPVCGAKDARHASAQDDKVMGVPGCLRHVGSEFEQIIRVLAES